MLERLLVRLLVLTNMALRSLTVWHRLIWSILAATWANLFWVVCIGRILALVRRIPWFWCLIWRLLKTYSILRIHDLWLKSYHRLRRARCAFHFVEGGEADVLFLFAGSIQTLHFIAHSLIISFLTESDSWTLNEDIDWVSCRVKLSNEFPRTRVYLNRIWVVSVNARN